jgi:hypothetical protein
MLLSILFVFCRIHVSSEVIQVCHLKCLASISPV